jgi:DEAD/DEAH box helicase domain-containing protein
MKKSQLLAGRKIAVFDAEIKKRIKDCSKGWQSHDEMGVSVLCIFDYATMRYRVFDDRNAQEAMNMLYGYDLVVGFNTVGFDWKLLKASWPEQCKATKFQIRDGVAVKEDGRISRDFDVLREIWLSLNLDPDRFNPASHGGYKLDDVAWETIKMRKTANGALAPVMFQEGRFADLVDYCLEDVRIERTLFEFVVDHGFVVRGGKVICIPFEMTRDDFLF